LTSAERDAANNAIFQLFTAGDNYKTVREADPYDALEDAVTESSARFTLLCSPRGKQRLAESQGFQPARLAFDMIYKDQLWKVTAVRVVAEFKEVVAVEAKERGGHPSIAKPKAVEMEYDGKKQKVYESELSPLGHLEDTPAPLRDEIDRLIEQLIDLKAKPAVRTAADRRLQEIAKPAVPRMLNKFYETKAETEEDRMRLNLINRTLCMMSGQSFGYQPGDVEGGIGGATEKQRISALKQWYAWWYRNHTRKNWSSVESDEDLEGLIQVPKDPKRRNADK
jgi:hypothetical protein